MASDADSKIFKNVVASSNKFSAALFKLIGNDQENCFFSPISIYIALVLTYTGAAGETAEDLKKSMHLPESKDELLQGVRELLDQLKNPKVNYATEIFIEKSYKVKADYIQTAKKFLDSESRLVDFKNAYAEAEKLINTWAYTQTKEKIKDLIPAGTLNEDTRLVLVNAIHFKDDWLKQFKTYNTLDDYFHISKEKTIKVPMMKQTERFNYLDKGDFKLLQLPYKDEDFSMVILLPKEIDGLKSLEEKLPSLNLSSLLNESEFNKVAVQLPKFKLEKFVDLTRLLSELGMVNMFTNKADFTGIFEPSEEPIKVSKVLHKAFVEVNEEGTEAAAATACHMTFCRSSMPINEPIFSFNVDHPFIFSILHRQASLFFGKVSSIAI